MISNDQELQAMIERVNRFQDQIAYLRRAETNPINYRLSAGGYLAELDRMNMEIREYLWLHPAMYAESVTDGEETGQLEARMEGESTHNFEVAYSKARLPQQASDLTPYEEFLRRRRQSEAQQQAPQQDPLAVAAFGNGRI
jgi:hypothetical protein